jgi:hypothetical protein
LRKAGLFDEHHSLVYCIETILVYSGAAMYLIENTNIRIYQQDEQGSMSGKSILSDVGG